MPSPSMAFIRSGSSYLDTFSGVDSLYLNFTRDKNIDIISLSVVFSVVLSVCCLDSNELPKS